MPEPDRREPAAVSSPAPIGAGVVVVAMVGLIATSALSWAVWVTHDGNEDRLLEQRTREAAAVLTTAATSLRAPLLAAADLADGNDGDRAAFERFMDPALDRKQFVSATLWRIDGSQPELIAAVGEPLLLGTGDPAAMQSELTRASTSDQLTVVDLIDGPQPRLGFASTASVKPVRFIVYAENALAANRTNQIRSGSAWSGLEFSIYLDREDRSHLIGASTDRLPLHGRRASESVPLGTNNIVLVMSPRGQLGGDLMAGLPWITAVTGLGLSVLSVVLAHHLLQQRREAEEHSARNRELFEAERAIATSLQGSLLPDVLPEVDGLEFAVRYRPGSQGVQIGGDWFDVTLLDDGRVLLVVGDVSGHGLAATAVMASLRFSTIAYAREGHGPASILSKLGRLLDLQRDGRFATMMCATIDADRSTVVLADAGHPSPILIDRTGARVVATAIGRPIGVEPDAVYEERSVDVAGYEANGECTLLAFTDGLYERRGENVDVGVERVRRRSEASAGTLDDLLDELMGDLGPGTDDDAAVLGVRWLSQATTTRAAGST